VKRAVEEDGEDERARRVFRSDFVREMLGDCLYGVAKGSWTTGG